VLGTNHEELFESNLIGWGKRTFSKHEELVKECKQGVWIASDAGEDRASSGDALRIGLQAR
jgi:hypothetical protein